MSQDSASESNEIPQPLSQHPLVGRLKPDPAQPAHQLIELAGLPGDSDRAGYQRIYLTARLDYYAEFLIEDVAHSEVVAADQSPLAGLEATRVGIRREATINYTWVRSPQPVDEWDLDVRLGGTMAGGPAIPGIAAPHLVWSEWDYCTRTPTCVCPRTVAGCAASPEVIVRTEYTLCNVSCFCAYTRGNNLTCAVGNCGGPV
jgi:hypothetical protein